MNASDERSGSLLRPVSRQRLVDQVADALRKAILEGTFRPGERLYEDQLSRQLGVSRTPLREAFRMLEEEGLVAVSPGRGVEVTQPDPKESMDLYDIREVLDGLAARRAARHAGKEVIDELERLMSQMEQHLAQRQFHEWLNCNIRFHEVIAFASGNKRLIRLLPAIRLTIQMFHPTLIADQRRPHDALAEHRRILEAIRAGAEDEAEIAARAHIQRAKALLAEKLGAER